MGSAWRKVKVALGLRLCAYVPEGGAEGAGPPDGAGLSSPCPRRPESRSRSLQTTPTASFSSRMRFSRSGSRSSSSQKICAICLGAMKPGSGHALFTAECSHIFHFQCITSNVKYGNHICPVCRAKWNEVPFEAPPTASLSGGRDDRLNPFSFPPNDGQMTILRQPRRVNSTNRQAHTRSLSRTLDPISFADDEPLPPKPSQNDSDHHCVDAVEFHAYPEFSAIQRSISLENFSVLVHLKAPMTVTRQASGANNEAYSCRAPVDLVTVLDVSGSMAGTKLVLLKRAMGFVIQNLGPYDRLSIVSFSSNARRIFPLCRMSESGRQHAIQAVNSLVSSGGTNIREGLRKGAKVIDDRREKNPVCSIILLSDGQDTYTLVSSSSDGLRPPQPDYMSLLPFSIRAEAGQQVPVHAFGFGSDHDSASMHSISDISGGTFSFIEAEGVIQDAFARCIGGLLSVVVQDLHVDVECIHPDVRIDSIKSGSYISRVLDDKRTGSVVVGDLYAEEERDFLVSINVPEGHEASDETSLLKVKCVYSEPVSKETINLEADFVKIRRPEVVFEQVTSIEVDRQRNRIQAAEAMTEAMASAERGVLSDAVKILEDCRRDLSESLAGRSGDGLCLSLDAELLEMQARMANRQRYEMSGRAYVLSGLNSHSLQRATTRGDSLDSMSFTQVYQTTSMADMLQHSQSMRPIVQQSGQHLRPSLSFPVTRRSR